MTATDAALRALRLRCATYRMCVAGDRLVGSSRAAQAHADTCAAIDRAEAAGASTAEVEVVMRAEGLLSGSPRATSPVERQASLDSTHRMGGTA